MYVYVNVYVYVWCVICVVCDMCSVLLCVVCVTCVVSCVVVMCAILLVLHRKRSRVYVQNVPVCTFKTPVSQRRRAF